MNKMHLSLFGGNQPYPPKKHLHFSINVSIASAVDVQRLKICVLIAISASEKTIKFIHMQLKNLYPDY